MGILERIEHGPGVHGVGSPDNRVDEDNAEDVSEHSSDADDDGTKIFKEEETA